MKYETAVPVGRGGIAEVLRAYDPELKRDVALKLLRRDDPVLAERMLREAQAQARVEHPNVCPVYETGTTDDGQLYIAMQFIDGVTLDVAAREMSLEEKVRVLREVAMAVQAAHTAGLIHRDLKPGNILAERQSDGSLKPWVVDFGLARQRDAPGLTITGQVMGTPAYMPPEQARGEHEAVDRRSDVWALGAVLYHLLAGGPPFTGQSTVDVLVKILQTDPVPVRKVVPHVPADLETIAMKCLEKEPERRYASARALAEDLGRFLEGEPITARRVSVLYQAYRQVRKNKLVTALAAAIVIGLPAGLLKYALDLDSERRRALVAQRQAEELMDFMLRDLYDRLQAVGRVDVLGEVARKSLRHYEERADEDLDSATLHRRALALRNVGLVLEEEGDVEEAYRSFARFQSIMWLLRGRDAENLDWRLDLAESYRMTGETLQEQGRIEEAMAHYRASLEMSRDLTRRDARRDDWQKVLWYGYTNVGWLLLERGDLEEAMEHFETGLAVVRGLRQRLPDDGEVSYNLSSNLAYIGLVQQDQGRLEAALTSFNEALGTSQALAASEPSNIRWQFEVALDYGRVAYVQQEIGDLAGSARSYGLALEVSERLVERDPSNAKWTRELSVSYSGLAAVERRLGRLEAARGNMERSLAISRRLAGLDASNLSLQNDLAWDLIQLGMVHEALSDPAAARTVWQEALAIITPVADVADVPYYRDTQVMALLSLGRVEDARPIVERLLEGGWDDPEFLDLCRRHGLLPSPPLPLGEEASSAR